jgi:methionyl aminopeptidase
MAIITAAEELADLRRSGRIAAQALRQVVAAVQPGVTTAALNDIAESAIVAAGGRPSFKGYEGYPAGLCTSVNDEVVHGIPSTDRVLANGDIVGLDIGVEYQGMFSDHAVTVAVGTISPEKQQLLDDTLGALQYALKVVKPGARIGDIGAAVQEYLKLRTYGIVTQLTGHGLGYAVHEEPSIPNVGKAGSGPQIVAGMVLAIEPMINLGTARVVTLDDGWTVATADHQPAAHFEHTVLVTEHGCEIITTP